MFIQPGTPAPDFQVQDSFGNPIKLQDYAGKWLLLSFFRNGACAMCNLRVHQLIQKYPALQAQNLKIITVFESPSSSINQYVGKQNAPFPIVPDPTAKLYALYGLENSEEKVHATREKPEFPTMVQSAAAIGFALTPEEGSNFFRMPADFLIAPDSSIQIAHYAEYVYDHLELEILEAAIKT
jgi:thioredoxin-dependent peroxiredoxin